MTSEKHIATPQPIPVRLSDYAVGVFSIIQTRKGIKKAIDKGWVTVNGKVGRTADFIYGGEELILTPEAAINYDNKIDLDVLYEDDYLAIINKPAGITVSGNKSHTVQNALGHNLEPSPLNDALEPAQLVHRLDHPTSGLIIAGKTRSSVVALGELFQNRTIQKTYHAIAIGDIPQEGIIDSPIDDKPSETSYQVIQSQDSERFGQLNLVEVQPKTGRKHQIRKHLFSIGHPILGDKEYFIEGLVLTGKGLYLNASRLEFIHPQTGAAIDIYNELPEKFRKIFNSVSD